MPPKRCAKCTITNIYKNEIVTDPALPVGNKLFLNKILNPSNCKKTKATPRTKVSRR